MSARAKTIHVIIGPTAVGKSAVALELAVRIGGEIVNADSIQMYRELDIGSAKPSPAERKRVPHHILDILDPTERIDAAKFAALADSAITEIAARGRLPIVVGGSGLWLRALLHGLVDLPTPDPELRRQLAARAQAHGAEALHAELRHVDPTAAERIHPNDVMRVSRALEVYQQTGVPLSKHQTAHRLGAARYDAAVHFLTRAPDDLARRIAGRTQVMLEAGLVAEAERLMATYGVTAPALHSVGYRQVRDHLLGLDVRPAPLHERIAKATRRYAHQQLCFFRGEPYVTEPRVLASEDPAQVAEHLVATPRV